jgi:tRNA U34 2-thiouridine synthase MnmA/TrmU
MSDLPRVVVAMSGGVDSSVAAALLKEQGYTVIGAMLALWTEPGFEDKNRCCAPEAMNLARRVAAILGIPFYALDARRLFHQRVVQPFIDGYAQGITPNPCLFCNRWVRWDYLLNWALAFGAEFLATGHYARLVRGQTIGDGGRTTEAGGPRTDPVSRLPSPVSGLPSSVSHLPSPVFRLPSPVSRLRSPVSRLLIQSA